jgi:hypothetical protein
MYFDIQLDQPNAVLQETCWYFSRSDENISLLMFRKGFGHTRGSPRDNATQSYDNYMIEAIMGSSKDLTS